MCANLTLTLSLEKIVIGGGIMKRGEVLLNHIREAFKERIAGYLEHPKLSNLDDYIVRSKFEDQLGMLAAATVGATGEVIGAKKLSFELKVKHE